MKYLPITLIATLSASLAVALFFTPTLGALLGKAAPVPHDERAQGPRALHAHRAARAAPSRHDAGARRAPAGRGAGRLRQVRPRRRVLPQGRARLRPGDRARAAATSRSTRRTACSAEVEKRVLAFDGLKTVYTRVGEQPRGMSEITEDTIGVIQFEFADWRTRPPGARDHGRDPRQDRRHSRHPGRGDGAARRARRPASRSRCSSRALDPAVLPAAAKKVAAHARRRAATSAISTTASRCPASTGRSRSTRRRPRNTAPASTPSAARCSSSPTA